MVAWYQEVFGATIKSKSAAMSFLTYDEEDHRFAIANLQAMKPEHIERDRPGLVGVDHISYTLDSLAEGQEP